MQLIQSNDAHPRFPLGVDSRALAGLSFLAFVLAGCFGVQTIRLDDKLAVTPYLDRDFVASREACFAATKSALEETGTEIKTEDLEAGKIETKRRGFMASAYVPGRSGTTSSTTSGSSTSITTTPARSGHMVSQAQEYKYYIVVSGDSSSCNVNVVRFRVWLEGKEAHEVPLAYARDNVWGPFFAEIEEALAGGF